MDSFQNKLSILEKRSDVPLFFKQRAKECREGFLQAYLSWVDSVRFSAYLDRDHPELLPQPGDSATDSVLKHARKHSLLQKAISDAECVFNGVSKGMAKFLNDTPEIYSLCNGSVLLPENAVKVMQFIKQLQADINRKSCAGKRLAKREEVFVILRSAIRLFNMIAINDPTYEKWCVLCNFRDIGNEIRLMCVVGTSVHLIHKFNEWSAELNKWYTMKREGLTNIRESEPMPPQFDAWNGPEAEDDRMSVASAAETEERNQEEEEAKRRAIARRKDKGKGRI